MMRSEEVSEVVYESKRKRVLAGLGKSTQINLISSPEKACFFPVNRNANNVYALTVKLENCGITYLNFALNRELTAKEREAIAKWY